MWKFTGYILYKLYELGRTSVGLDEPVRFVFGRLWGEYNAVLNDDVN